MQQIVVSKPGGPEALELREAPIPVPGPEEILIKLAACGVNFIDIYHRTGIYPVSYPSALGLEGAGTVVRIGARVTRFKVGDRAAFCLGPLGAYAGYVAVAETKAVIVPAFIDLETAAAILLKGLTAEFLVRRLKPLKKGDTVLFHAAAGGVGLMACTWLAHLGVRVIGTVGSEVKADLAHQHGCDATILYRKNGFVDQVMRLTDGKGCTIVYDSIGADTFMDTLACCETRGLIVSFGNASGPPPAISPLELSKRGSLFLTRPTLFDYVSTRQELDEAASSLFSLVQSGIIRPLIGARRKLVDAASAHKELESRNTVGSTILIPEPSE
ncbi:quinone oxidoreductase family protein [Candidatus Phycosocius spiralis]|uniref:Quinone oxidoreductase n=1 Tax=Candidatus Phycosocius spiralis TaxID=2815099 RepID=A0ABQ4PXM6_9PROT|nr:quinone oxidoreductase [Candidatus Phycosocius spiralis]GIU67670.1 quinone oxidoreductase [Candidatus Phycosocius spiralis]